MSLYILAGVMLVISVSAILLFSIALARSTSQNRIPHLSLQGVQRKLHANHLELEIDRHRLAGGPVNAASRTRKPEFGLP